MQGSHFFDAPGSVGFTVDLVLVLLTACTIFPSYTTPHPAKIDLNKKWLQKQNTIQNFNIDAQGFRKTRNENPPTWEIGVTS